MNEPLIRTLRVNCPIAHAFHTFTDGIDLWWPAGHRRFGASTIILEARIGGRFLEREENGEEIIHGEVIRCIPPERITYTWYPGAISEPTEVDIRFTDMGDYTLVEVTHAEGRSGLGEVWPQRVTIFGRSWDEVLRTFTQHLEESDRGTI